MKEFVIYGTNSAVEIARLQKSALALGIKSKENAVGCYADIVLIEYESEQHLSLSICTFREHNSRVRLIVRASERNFDMARACIRAGVSYILICPYVFEELKHAIRKTLNEVCDKPEVKHYSNLVNKALSYIRENYNKGVTLKDLADELSVSNWHLCKVIKKQTGQSFVEITTGLRIDKAKDLLGSTALKLGEVANFIGITEINYFINLFKKHVGISPTAFREQHRVALHS